MLKLCMTVVTFAEAQPNGGVQRQQHVGKAEAEAFKRGRGRDLRKGRGRGRDLLKGRGRGRDLLRGRGRGRDRGRGKG